MSFEILPRVLLGALGVGGISHDRVERGDVLGGGGSGIAIVRLGIVEAGKGVALLVGDLLYEFAQRVGFVI